MLIKPTIGCARDCKDRKAFCHSTCPIYIKYKQELNKYNHEILQQKIKERQLYEYAGEQKEKLWKNKHII